MTFPAPLTPYIKGSLGSGGIRSAMLTTGSPGYTVQTYTPIAALENYPPFEDDRTYYLDNRGGHLRDAGMVIPQYWGYLPTKVVDASYTYTQCMSDPEWAQAYYPARRRDLHHYQVPQKYIIGNTLVASQVWNPQNYFLGYAPSGGQGG